MATYSNKAIHRFFLDDVAGTPQDITQKVLEITVPDEAEKVDLTGGNMKGQNNHPGIESGDWTLLLNLDDDDGSTQAVIYSDRAVARTGRLELRAATSGTDGLSMEQETIIGTRQVARARGSAETGLSVTLWPTGGEGITYGTTVAA